jgi:RimJ/RimL family protein N-acetyltransferase
VIRPLRESDLDTADRIMRLAFGTFNQLEDPLSFMGDADFVHTRWRRDPAASVAAEVNGRLVGSNFAAHWGSFGFFGPLSIDPQYWGRGLAGPLVEAVMQMFDHWRVDHAALFTFPHSLKHIGLYQKYGFRPRMLTLVLEKTVLQGCSAENDNQIQNVYSALDRDQQATTRQLCRRLTDHIYSGLDVTSEIETVHRQDLGDTVLLWEGEDLAGFAICHSGAGSEAGSNNCYVKFAAAAPGADAASRFDRLIQSVEAFACVSGIGRMVAGVNTARREAYEAMLAAGYRLFRSGIAMHRPNRPGFCRPEVFVIDDWR